MSGQDENPKVAEFHKRAGKSHMEERKLLTAMAVGSIGVLYATLTGKDAPALTDDSKKFAIGIIIAMGMSTMFGFVAWGGRCALGVRDGAASGGERIEC